MSLTILILKQTLRSKCEGVPFHRLGHRMENDTASPKVSSWEGLQAAFRLMSD